MANRSKLHPTARLRRKALLEALRMSGGYTELVAQRARKLLAWAPQDGRDNLAWLREILPEPWHYTTTVAALRKIYGTAAPTQDAEGNPPPPARRTRRGGRDR